MSRPFEIYFAYVRRCILAFIQFRADALISVFSILISQFAAFVAVWAISRAIGDIGGWHFYDLTLVFSIFIIISALNQIFFDGVWNIGNVYVRRGMLDVLLTRPIPVLAQVVCQRMEIGAVSLAIAGASLLGYSLFMLDISVTLYTVLIIMLFIICGVAISTSLYLIANSINFWLVQGNEIADLVQLVQEFSRYPMGVFPTGIRLVFTFIMPFAFATYYPASILTGRMPGQAIWFVLLAAVACVAAAAFVWCKGVKSYNGTGS
ncbi:MAG: ABC-2 family transporter protein [Defluviitaleaceae bacterium]|nr:ABC-2 family transporter protein [Defluviitaleaceae bacterium]